MNKIFSRILDYIKFTPPTENEPFYLTAQKKDTNYFNQAEKYLYNEFSVVLGMSYDDTKQYVIDKVLESKNKVHTNV